jgi:glycosyltransferase involved in cell wall biosynthesis
VTIRITSTALNVGELAYKSVRSVYEQTYKEWTLDFFDAASTDDTNAQACRAIPYKHGLRQGQVTIHAEPKGKRTGPLDKLIPLWRSFPDADIICWLDGDDQLATCHALETVATYHRAGAIVTYGSCLLGDGRVGWTRPVVGDVRKAQFSCGHLKTFRAGAFKLIQDSNLRDEDGSYYSLSIDRCVMFPLLELFPERSVWVNKYLYIYNFDASYDAKATPAQAAEAERVTRRIHALPSYARSEWLPGDLAEDD